MMTAKSRKLFILNQYKSKGLKNQGESMKLIKIFLISLMLLAISMMFLGCNNQPRDTGQEREQEQAQPKK